MAGAKNLQERPIGVFNYAHTYAQSAVELEVAEVDATHPHSPVYFLYFHAIELYLKAYLLANGIDLETMRKGYGHRVRKLADDAKIFGLQLDAASEDVITLMDATDNVITARYLRTGMHTRLPFSSLFDLCRLLHGQVGEKAYDGSGVTRLPVLSDFSATSQRERG